MLSFNFILFLYAQIVAITKPVAKIVAIKAIVLLPKIFDWLLSVCGWGVWLDSEVSTGGTIWVIVELSGIGLGVGCV
jgi:hypothetical protein